MGQALNSSTRCSPYHNSRESLIELKLNRIADNQLPKIRMRRINQKITFSRDQRTREPQHHRPSGSDPFIPNPSQSHRSRVSPPIPRQMLNLANQTFFDPHANEHIVLQQFRPAQVNEHFQHR
jgi:hypothetical protein